MHNNQFKLILASQSPRRRELLGWTFIPFTIVPSTIEEIVSSSNPLDVVTMLAKQKASDIFSSYPNDMILGADTIVVSEGEILGKPKNVDDARKMLLRLSGKTHEVYTGVCLLFQNEEKTFFAKTQVTFREIASDLLEFYLKTEESLDKAGAYGIQGASLGFIEKINGSYSNVVGLPVDLVLEKIEEILFPLYGNNWRLCFQK